VEIQRLHLGRWITEWEEEIVWMTEVKEMEAEEMKAVEMGKGEGGE
jgi:hypothetical protein